MFPKSVNYQKYKLFVIAKFKELQDEYEFELNYKKRTGYSFKSTNPKKNKDKIQIQDYITSDMRKGLVNSFKKLPQSATRGSFLNGFCRIF